MNIDPTLRNAIDSDPRLEDRLHDLGTDTLDYESAARLQGWEIRPDYLNFTEKPGELSIMHRDPHHNDSSFAPTPDGWRDLCMEVDIAPIHRTPVALRSVSAEEADRLEADGETVHDYDTAARAEGWTPDEHGIWRHTPTILWSDGSGDELCYDTLDECVRLQNIQPVESVVPARLDREFGSHIAFASFDPSPAPTMRQAPQPAAPRP